MTGRHYIAATAGHVDHGKSALVQALTGVDPDRLAEEKRRGITIELGFAHLTLVATGRGDPLRVGMVDVPGHEDFVKNMVAGVGAVDLALLVVAANEGWMPQTEEHLQILEYLGARSTLIALTKSDLTADPTAYTARLRRVTAGTRFEDCPVVPVSALSGNGLDELRRRMARLLDAQPPRADTGTPRLAVDRAFTVAGAGTVVTGTLAGGSFGTRQEVAVHPGDARARIRTIQSFNQAVDRVGPATRVALNLPDAGQRGGGRRPLRRGDVIARPQTVASSDCVDLRLTRSARPVGGSVIQWLRDGARVRLHFGTANLAAVVRLEQPPHVMAGLAPGGSCWGRLQLEQGRPFLVGDRVVLRDWSQRHTLAGGVILDPAPRRPLRTAAQRDLLHATGRDPHDVAVVLQARAAAAGVVQCSQLARLLPVDHAAVQRAAAALERRGVLRLFADLAADAGWFERQADAVRGAIERDLHRHPERPGVAVAALRAERRAALTAAGDEPAVAALPAVLDALLAELARRGYRRDGSLVRPPGHAAALPPGHDRALAAVRAALAANPLTPPGRAQLAARPGGNTVVAYLIARGELVVLDGDVVLGAAAHHRARRAVVEHLQRAGSATTSALRSALGTNRRVIVPLLEKLDREGVTQRVGNERTLA